MVQTIEGEITRSSATKGAPRLEKNSRRLVVQAEPPPPRPRYPGLDLVKVAAAFGVIQTHLGGGDTPLGGWFKQWMLQGRVPVFMLIALYVTTERWLESRSVGRLSSRLQRLLLPFLAWTLIHQGSRLFVRLFHRDSAGGFAEFEHPVDFLLGYGSPLYFLPWLAIGTVLVFAATSWAEWIQARLRIHWTIVCGVFGVLILALAAIILESRGGMLANPVRALRTDTFDLNCELQVLSQGVSAFIFNALPYIAVAMIAHSLGAIRLRLRAHWAILAAFVGLWINHSALALPINSTWPRICAAAAGGLLFGLCLPCSLRLPHWIRSAAGASYGIYLSHNSICLLVDRISEWFTGVSFGGHGFGFYLLGTCLTFAASWALTLQLQRFSWTRRVLLGGS